MPAANCGTPEGRPAPAGGGSAPAIYLIQEALAVAYKITDECISCGACESECPNDAISEGDVIYVINPATCSECVGFFDESQCAAVCPVDCCVPDPDNPRAA